MRGTEEIDISCLPAVDAYIMALPDPSDELKREALCQIYASLPHETASGLAQEKSMIRKKSATAIIILSCLVNGGVTASPKVL